MFADSSILESSILESVTEGYVFQCTGFTHYAVLHRVLAPTTCPHLFPCLTEPAPMWSHLLPEIKASSTPYNALSTYHRSSIISVVGTGLHSNRLTP